MTALTEDDFYRSSTQYRFWAFTPQSLANLRASTNTNAANGVKAAMANLHKQEQVAGQDHNAESSEGENKSLTVDCLTVEEEQKLVGFYCVRAMQLADFCDFPTNVKVRRAGFLSTNDRADEFDILLGNCCTIPQAILPLQLAHDLSP